MTSNRLLLTAAFLALCLLLWRAKCPKVAGASDLPEDREPFESRILKQLKEDKEALDERQYGKKLTRLGRQTYE